MSCRWMQIVTFSLILSFKMDQDTLERLLKSNLLISSPYAGCYFRDTLPELEDDKVYLINTCFSSSEIGEHWCACDLRFPKKVLWLCSYNTRPRSFSLIWQRIKATNRTICCFDQRLQAPQLSNCSIFVCFFLYMTSRGIGPKAMTKYFFREKDLYKISLWVTEVTRILFNIKASTESLLYDPIFVAEQEALVDG